MSTKSTFLNRIIKAAPLALLCTAIGGVASVARADRKPSIRSQRSAPITGFNLPQAWPGKRPLLLLPLQYGKAFNVDKTQFKPLKIYAQQAIENDLMQTRKFSVFQTTPHSPTLSRGVLDEKVTKDQVNTLIKAPTIDNANVVLKKLQFDSEPLIAIFSIDKILTYSLPLKHHKPQAPVVQAQVSGTLYRLDSKTPFRTVTMTSTIKPQAEMGFWPNDRVMLAIDNAAYKIAQEFIKPPAPLNLPLPVGPAYPEKQKKHKLKGAKPITWKAPAKATKHQ